MIFLDGKPGNPSAFIVRMVRDTDTTNRHIRTSLRSSPDTSTGGPSNLLIIFGFSKISEFWYAGVDLSGDLSKRGIGCVIGHAQNNGPRTETFNRLDLPLERGSLFTLDLSVSYTGGALVLRLVVNDDSTLGASTEIAPRYINNGTVGVGAYRNSIQVFDYRWEAL